MRLIIVGVFLFCTSLSAQVGGSNTYQFLDLLPSPRHMSLGTWVPTLSTASINSSLANPAQVSDSIRGQIVFNYQPYFAGINRGTAAVAIANEAHTILVDTDLYMEHLMKIFLLRKLVNFQETKLPWVLLMPILLIPKSCKLGQD